MIWLVCAVVLLVVTYYFLDFFLRSFKVGHFEEKYVLITGCDSGFGQALAGHLDSLGFHVFAGCLTHVGREYLAKNCSKRLVTVLLDVSKTESVEAALELVKRTLPEDKGLWGLVNNAGILGNPSIIELCSKDDFLKVLGVNLIGMTEMNRCFLPLVRKSRGRVVNTSSIAGRLAAGSMPYTVSKYGVEAYSDLLRRELKNRGVKVAIIEPGTFKTSLADFERIKQTVKTAFDERANDDIKQAYGDILGNGEHHTEFFKPTPIISSNINLVVDAYTHALTSRYPRTRYTVGPDAKFILIPMSYLPTWLTDRILSLQYN
ncbi:unnamed protein product [Lymnaea stagnalis]|uniref:Uncharacterized protein n=1 Tax=Lymnaea stagnalis TaxID=6523 RepID=A0AAV2HTE8_LYMST